MKESSRFNNAMVVLKLVVLAFFVGVGLLLRRSRELAALRAQRLAASRQGAAIVFFAYIGFDAISTAAEETKNPQRNMPIGIIGSLVICTIIYAVVGRWPPGIIPYRS